VRDVAPLLAEVPVAVPAVVHADVLAEVPTEVLMDPEESPTRSRSDTTPNRPRTRVR
jgi:hypothetical protein